MVGFRPKESSAMESAAEQYVAQAFSHCVTVRRLPWSYGVESALFHGDCLICWAESLPVKAPRAALAAVRLNRRKYLRLLDLGRVSGKPGVVVVAWLDGAGIHVVDGLAGVDRGFAVLPSESFRGVACTR